LAFIRPGLVVNVVDFTIPDDLHPVVEFTTANEGGMPLDMAGVYTLGDIDMRFMLTYIPEGETQKVSYTGGSYDRGGEYTTMAVGHYTYRFANVLPSDYDADATTTLTAVGTRDLRDFDLERYYDNVVMNTNGTTRPGRFVPAGPSLQFREFRSQEASSSLCHRRHLSDFSRSRFASPLRGRQTGSTGNFRQSRD